MKYFILAVLIFASTNATASEKAYYSCSSNSSEFRTLLVKQVITKNGSSVSSTFKLDVTNDEGVETPYWQDGDVRIGTDDSFAGPFKSGTRLVEVDIRTPTFPDYQPRESTLTEGSVVVKMICNSL